MGEDLLDQPLNRYAPYKSWGEHRIAGLLDRYGLPFIYEKPTAVMDGGQARLWYPDFSLAYGILIEYFGIAGDPHYDLRTQHKLRVYGLNQFDVLPVYRHDLGRGWDDNLLGRIDRTLEGRVMGYRSAIASAQFHPFTRRNCAAILPHAFCQQEQHNPPAWRGKRERGKKHAYHDRDCPRHPAKRPWP